MSRSRITLAQLEATVLSINKATGSPVAPYAYIPSLGQPGGVMAACIGNYHLGESGGCVGLFRMTNENGGTETIFHCGPKRGLLMLMQAFLLGLHDTDKATDK